MIIINGYNIIDIKHNNNSLSGGLLNNTVVYKRTVEYFGATEINIGDTSEYKLCINNKVYSNISITNLNNSNDILITDNKLTFLHEGIYNIDLSYKEVHQIISVNVKRVSISIE